MEHQISPDADLVVHLTNSDSSLPITKYYVTASSLRQASPVLSRIIAPGPRFKQPSRIQHAGRECLLVTLEDDDSEALRIVFHLLHLNFDALPGIHAVTWETMRDTALIWDKYNISNLIRPPWLSFFRRMMMGPACEDWLFYGKVFRKEKGYAELTALLVIELGDNPKENRVRGLDTEFVRGERPVEASLWPHLIKDHITTERTRLIQKLDFMITSWKRRFKGTHPRAKCTCSAAGDGDRYFQHMSLAEDMCNLFQGVADPFTPVVRNSYHPYHGHRLPARYQVSIDDLGWHWTGSIVDLRSFMKNFCTKQRDRDMRNIAIMIENPDIYDLCPLEESSLRIIWEFYDITAVVKGITIDGEEVDFDTDRLRPEIAFGVRNQAETEPKWDGLKALGLKVFGLFMVLSALMVAIVASVMWK
ncbi:hypothetical protein ABW21_db0204518 [Orbilia brochopaga]|nr:hypothetical protein ABW21_db0204518 [Drechslerella brochopaga]